MGLNTPYACMQRGRADLRRLESILKKRARQGDVVVLESQAVGKVGKASCATNNVDMPTRAASASAPGSPKKWLLTRASYGGSG